MMRVSWLLEVLFSDACLCFFTDGRDCDLHTLVKVEDDIEADRWTDWERERAMKN